MARLARVVVPGIPRHITQRGNRRQAAFFCGDDYEAYLELMAEWCHEQGVEIWAYCLVPNHTYPWSSARAHIRGRDDVLVKVSPMLALVNSWRELLCSAVSEEELRQFRAHERAGRPLGDEDFVKRLERKFGRVLQRRKPGRRRSRGAN